MYCSEFILKNYRNIHNAKVQFSPQTNLFVGDNGHGKTNLLEAIHYLLTGSLFRPGSYENLLPIDGGKVSSENKFRFTDLHLKIQESEKIWKVGYAQDHLARKFALQGKVVSHRTLRNHFPAKLFSPEALAYLKSGPEIRRELIDEAVVFLNPKAEVAFSRFDRALRQRNRVLRQWKEGAVQEHQAHSLLSALNPIYFSLAAEITELRLMALRALEPFFRQALNLLLGPIHELENHKSFIDYRASGRSLINAERNEISEVMRLRYQELWKSEGTSGISLVGPHKHEISFIQTGRDARFFSSQGQQRALILAFFVAQVLAYRVQKGRYPILFLDDVFSELDRVKRSNLLSFLYSINSQIFMTTTEPNFTISGFLDLKLFAIHSGQIQEQTATHGITEAHRPIE